MQKKTTNFRIGVIGHTGMVGSNVYLYFKRKNFKVIGYSLDKKEGEENSSWKEINNKCGIIFICVPTPYDWKKNKTNLNIVESIISKIAPNKIAIIKSTVWPGTTKRLQKKYPRLKFIFNPEFLSRTSAREDFEYPDRQIVGYTKNSKAIASKILKILPRAPYSKIMKAEEAELIKYSHNVWGAIRIMWANHLYDVATELKIDYDIVKEGFAASKFIGKGILRYMTIFHNGKRGFGGPCFPKDIASYIEFCKKIGVYSDLPQAARNQNRRLLKIQGITEQKSEKF